MNETNSPRQAAKSAAKLALLGGRKSVEFEHTAALRAQAVLDHLFADCRISNDGDWSRASQIVSKCFNDNTVYASIAVEEDEETIFYWRAREMSIEIHVYPGEGYWWSARNVGGESYKGEGAELPFAKLPHSLARFSDEVDAANSRWREQEF